MSITSQNEYKTLALDPKVLSTPFEVHTNWHVITGAACTGKTTLVDLLAERGYPTVEETARLYFEQELAKGRTVEEIRADGATLQRGILGMQLEVESGLETSALAFLDRGIPDCITFYRIFGLNPHEVLPRCFHYRYASVFILDRLPILRENQLGPEDDESSDYLDEWLERDYRALGYEVIRVPVLPPEARADFVLERVG